jgi:hypothetical protein
MFVSGLACILVSQLFVIYIRTMDLIEIPIPKNMKTPSILPLLGPTL